MIESREQDPGDKLDYVINWRAGDKPGLALTESITTSTWATYDADWAPTSHLTVHTELNTNDATTATGWVSVADGFEISTRGENYYFTNHIVTDEGRQLSQSIKLKIRER